MFSSPHFSRFQAAFRSTYGVLAMNLMLVLFMTLSVQFIAKVYAMSHSLFWSTTETNEAASIVMGDFDGDGDVDWIAHHVSAGAGAHDLYLNNGAGSFSHSTFGSANTATSFATGDANGDGDLDPYYFYNSGNDLARCSNNGLASLSCANIANFPFQNNNNLAMGDFDNDGDQDLLKSNSSAAGQTHFLRNHDRKGTFVIGTGATMPTLGNKTMRPADMNSDGFLDFVAIDSSADPIVHLNSGTGSFTQSYVSALTLRNAIALADFDGDGDIDIAVANSANNIYVLTNNGLGTSFGSTSTTSVGGSVNGMGSGDLDNDGDMDLVVALSSGGSKVYFNNGSGVFSENGSASETGDTSNVIGIGDIEADGDLDYVRGTAMGFPNRIYASDQSTTLANTAPSAPSTFTATVETRVPRSGGTFADDSGVGTVTWTAPSNAALSDDSSATATSMNGGDISHYLKATGFNVNLPPDAVISGIKVEVERKYTGTLTARDSAVRIVKGGTIQSTDFGSADLWPAADAYATYGGTTELWGTTWTPSDINASNFGFAIAMTGDSGSGGGSIDHIRITVYSNYADVTVSWGSGSDAQSATKMLQYQVKMGTGSNTNSTVSGITNSPQWVTRLMPNGKSRTYALKNIRCGLTYYWSVATVDTGFRSTWSAEQTIALSSTCTIPEASQQGGGGGKFIPPPPAPEKKDPGTGFVTITAFNDLNGDGYWEPRETTGFKGLPIRMSGRSITGLTINTALTLDDNGKAVFTLPPSDDNGYRIVVDTQSAVIDGFEPTGETSFGPFILEAGDEAIGDIGFHRTALIEYAPCLTIGDASPKETKGTDAHVLLQRLKDSFGSNVDRGVELGGKLVSRHAFFTLLARTQCVTLVQDSLKLAEKLRVQSQDHGLTLPLIDLPVDTTKVNSLLVYSLIAAGVDVSRSTPIGAAADLLAPITRAEAIRAIRTVLNIPHNLIITEGDPLPTDLRVRDPLASDFLTLQGLGILPDSFLPVLGSSQGIDSDETALLITRTAFRGGKISLHPEQATPTENTPTVSTFLSVLPPLKERACLEKDKDRPSEISFSDILPGSPLFAGVRDILAIGTKNAMGKTLWLFSATRRPTEFGILRGQTKIGMEEPVSILEVIRDLLVLNCNPPETTLDVLSGKSQSVVVQGTGESRVVRDRIAGLPRDASLASRVLYGAQDRQKEFDLSLFTYMPEFLRGDERNPGDGLSVVEASRVLASGLLMSVVSNGELTPLEAENTMESLSSAILNDLVGREVTWRNISEFSSTPFTRNMLVEFLATTVSRKTVVPVLPAPSPIPLGELWWELVL